MWVTFTEIEGYGIVMAEIRDIAVGESFRRQGIGTEFLRTVEATARRNGAALLRSEAGIENVASDGLYKSFGFETYRAEYEKVLDRTSLE